MSSTLCPPCTKPTTLNADRKAQNRRNARARVFKVRLICPAVVTKCEGPRSSRLQPAQLRAAPLRAIRARAREAKTFQPLLAPLVTMHSAALPALALQRPQGHQAAPTRRAHRSHSTDGRKDPAGRRGGRFARAQAAASARRPRGSRAPGCSAPWSASSPTCRASASAAGRRLPRNTP